MPLVLDESDEEKSMQAVHEERQLERGAKRKRDERDVAMDEALWEGTHSVAVPHMNVLFFKHWDAFHEQLDRYSKETFQIFRVRTSKTIRTLNNELELANADFLFPSVCGDYYTKTMMCTHGGKKRRRGECFECESFEFVSATMIAFNDLCRRRKASAATAPINRMQSTNKRYLVERFGRNGGPSTHCHQPNSNSQSSAESRTV